MKVPLRTILKNFLEHVEDLEKRQKLADDQYETEFQELKKLTDKLREDPAYSSSAAFKDVNRPKNRYKDIVPYDFSRVILPKYDGIPGSDYINASYVKGASGAFAYIAAQGPLPNSLVDFWRMIWVCEVQVIVMACNVQEAGRYKCEKYWPDQKEILNFGNVSVELIQVTQVCPDFLVRTLLVKCDSEMRDVYQFHYTSWPDHGAPDIVQPLLELVRLMRDCQASETVPILVHCSAGCGRTGTICAVDFVWACLRHGKLDEDFSLFNIALELRRQRIAMIQTKEQYILAHKAVAAMFEQQLKVIDCHIYENIDEDGEPLMWKELSMNIKSALGERHREWQLAEKTVMKNENHVDAVPKGFKNSVSEACSEKSQLSREKAIHHDSSVDITTCSKISISDSLISKNSDSSFSRNSYLSEQNNDEAIPFIDDDEISIRPNCGRAYLNIPSCESFSKLMDSFDPFVDQVSLGTDDSSPEGDNFNKLLEFNSATNSDVFKSQDNEESSKKNQHFNLDTNPSQQSSFTKFSTLNICSKNRYDMVSNRESYPPSSSREKFKNNSDSDFIENRSGSSANEANLKLVGKATVVRRPSISKLKALFEKSTLSSNKVASDIIKRPLFRHNSHCVSRAGSAPPSLNCMDKNAEVERNSILMMVTRKFRSSSVRSERELNSKQSEKCVNKKSTAGALNNFKDSLCTLSRNMSLSFSKTFKNSSSKSKVDDACSKMPAKRIPSHVKNAIPSQVPDTPAKGKSTWYDRSSLPRAIAIVKPTEKIPAPPATLVKYQALKHEDEKIECQKQPYPVLHKKDKKLSETGDLIVSTIKDTPTNDKPEECSVNVLSVNKTPPVVSNISNLKYNSKSSTYKSVPFFQSVTPWKKFSTKSPLHSPTSPKQTSEFYLDPNIEISNSTFYAGALDTTQNVPICVAEEKITNVSRCPVPDEIIQLKSTEQTFWPPNTLASPEPSSSELIKNQTVLSETNQTFKSLDEASFENSLNEQPSNIQGDQKTPVSVKERISPKERENFCNPDTNSLNKNAIAAHDDQKIPNKQTSAFEETKVSCDFGLKNQCVEQGKDVVVIENLTKKSSKDEKLGIGSDVPPAIPKKMVIGKNKNSEFYNSTTEVKEKLTNITKNEILPEPNNESALNENEDIIKSKETGCNLTDEKNDVYINVNVKAVKNIEQIENTLRKNPRGAIIDLTSRESYSMEEDLALAVRQLTEREENTKVFPKNNSKYPGYEVIWPENRYFKTSGCKSNKDIYKNRSEVIKESLSKENKTGICYSPPLRRSVNSKFSLTKSQSCDRLDWLKPNRITEFENLKDQLPTPAKKLVNKAVVEFSTLLNQLTTRTLSEDNNVKCKQDSKSKQDFIQNALDCQNSKRNEIDASMTNSVTLVAKSCISCTSPTEEEIVFHFPPPPRVPPPPDVDPPVESFNVSYQNGSLVVTEGNKYESKKETSILTSDKINEPFPTPAPRRSKHSTNKLKKSASYSNICAPNVKTGYENIFLEKYQTLSRLEIKSNEVNNVALSETLVPKEKSSSKDSDQFFNKLPNYGNINVMQDYKGTNEVVSSKLVGFKSSKKEFIETGHQKSKESFAKINQLSEQSKSLQNVVENCNEMSHSEAKRKFLPSKKTERAPQPPNSKPEQITLDERRLHKLDNISSKKLPSRKLEKAPPPPLMQKSSSSINFPKMNMQISAFNFPASNLVNHESKLPALRENIPNVDCSKIDDRKKRFVYSKESISNHGLSHSQSDVSVYLALKERRALSMKKEIELNQRIKNKVQKQTQDIVNTSSSDSDGSYEAVSQPKPNFDCLKITEKTSYEEQIATAGRRYEIPVAPPRSKRRSTTEVQYAKVKPKEASLLQGTNAAREDILKKNSEAKMMLNQEVPPTVPSKTKDAYKVPDELLITGTNEASKTKNTASKTSSNL